MKKERAKMFQLKLVKAPAGRLPESDCESTRKKSYRETKNYQSMDMFHSKTSHVACAQL